MIDSVCRDDNFFHFKMPSFNNDEILLRESIYREYLFLLICWINVKEVQICLSKIFVLTEIIFHRIQLVIDSAAPTKFVK